MPASCFGTLATCLGIHTFCLHLTGQALEGFSTVILVALITGTAVRTRPGIISESIAGICEEVEARPQCVVRELKRGPSTRSTAIRQGPSELLRIRSHEWPMVSPAKPVYLKNLEFRKDIAGQASGFHPSWAGAPYSK